MLKITNNGRKCWVTSVSIPYSLFLQAKSQNIGLSSFLINALEERFGEEESKTELRDKLKGLANRLELACRDLEEAKKREDNLRFKIKFLETKFLELGGNKDGRQDNSEGLHKED